MKHIEKFEDVRSEQDAIDYGGNKGAKLTSVLRGYTEVRTPKGAVTLRNTDRPISKGEREWIRYLYWGMGLLTFAGIAFALLRMLV